MAFLILEKGPIQDIGKIFVLGGQAVLIGRVAPGNEPFIIVNDDYISRKHAVIEAINERFIIKDLGSSNGTMVNGILLKPDESTVLSHNSAIGLAIVAGIPHVILRFKITDKTLKANENLTIRDLIKSSWLRIDPENQEVWVEGNQINLTKNEYKLILLLFRKAGNVCTRDDIVSEVWFDVQDTNGVSETAIDQLVYRVRSKIEIDPHKPKRLINKKKYGYLLVI